MTSSQNTTKFIVLCCTICYTTTCFGPFLGHLQIFGTRPARFWGPTQISVQRVPGLLPGGKAVAGWCWPPENI